MLRSGAREAAEQDAREFSVELGLPASQTQLNTRKDLFL